MRTEPPGGYESWLSAGIGGFFGNIWDRATYAPRTVWANTGTPDYSLAGRVYVTAGTTLGSIVGVTQISDAGSKHDAVDGHVQSTGERVFKGVTGGVQLATIGVGLGSSAVRAAAKSAVAESEAALGGITADGAEAAVVPNAKAPLYEVDTAYNLRKNPAHGVPTDTVAEHVPQTKWSRDLIPDHSDVNAAGRESAIRVTTTEAEAITHAETLTQVPASAREAL